MIFYEVVFVIAVVVYLCCCCWFISAVFSWKRPDRRCWVARYFCTQRVTQPLSRVDTDLEVKSSMQEAKQWSTRLEKTYVVSMMYVPVHVGG